MHLLVYFIMNFQRIQKKIVFSQCFRAGTIHSTSHTQSTTRSPPLLGVNVWNVGHPQNNCFYTQISKIPFSFLVRNTIRWFWQPRVHRSSASQYLGIEWRPKQKSTQLRRGKFNQKICIQIKEKLEAILVFLIEMLSIKCAYFLGITLFNQGVNNIHTSESVFFAVKWL